MCYPFIDRVPPFRAYLKTSMLDDHLKQPITVGVLPRHGQAFGRQLPAEPSICDKLKHAGHGFGGPLSGCWLLNDGR